MLRKLMPVATAAALAALIFGGVSAASGSDDGDRGRDFTALDITIKDTGVDVDNSNSFTIGDQDIFTDVLKNRAGTQTIGSLTAVCTTTDIPKRRNPTDPTLDRGHTGVILLCGSDRLMSRAVRVQDRCPRSVLRA